MNKPVQCPYCDEHADPCCGFCDGTGEVTREALDEHTEALNALERAATARMVADLELWQAGKNRSDEFGDDIPW